MPQKNTTPQAHLGQTEGKVLIVEDDDASRKAIKNLLEARGFHVSMANTLAGGISALADGPRCIIVDLMLPDGNGVALIEEIRRLALPARIALTTGVSDPELLDQVKTLKPDLFLQKPIEMDRLLSWLTRCQLDGHDGSSDGKP